jgi:hypothetical protein
VFKDRFRLKVRKVFREEMVRGMPSRPCQAYVTGGAVYVVDVTSGWVMTASRSVAVSLARRYLCAGRKVVEVARL